MTLAAPAAYAIASPPAPAAVAPEAFPATAGSAALRLAPRHGRGPRTVTLHWQLVGPAGAPVIVALGGISADRQVCAPAPHAAPGWWEDLAGAGRALDTDRLRVLGIDWLDRESLGAVDAVASTDQADALAALLDVLGIGRLAAVVGASYGAMVGLAFAERHGGRLGQLVAISGAHRAHPMATAQRAIQRAIVRFGIERGDPAQGLALARALAMTSYRGAAEFAERFAAPARIEQGRVRFAVEDYLEAAGARFTARFAPERFLDLSESIDLHAVDPRAIAVPTTVVAVDGDRLVPREDLVELTAQLAGPARLVTLASRYGHDAFLKEPEQIGRVLRAALVC